MSAGSGGKKKKLSKAERLRLQKEEDERRMIEEEEARLRAELEEAARIEKERIEREKTELLEAKDQDRRGLELVELEVLEENFLTAAQWKEKFRASAKWEHYTGCDGSPDPTIPQEINTFMSLWKEEKDTDIKHVVEKGNKVLELIERLEFYILDTPFHELSASDVEQYQDTILHLQTLLHQKYDEATEQLLKQASSYAESESGNMEVVIKEAGITLCIWANLKKNPRFRSQTFYNEDKEPCNGFEIPKQLAVCDIAVRILHTHYDHISPLRAFPKELPDLDIPVPVRAVPEITVQETEERARKTSEISCLENVVGHTLREPQSHISTPSLQGTKSSTLKLESSRDSFDRKSAIIRSISRARVSSLRSVEEEEDLQDYMVDLNQFMTVGGVYHFDVLKLPPQAKNVKGWNMVEVLDTGLEICPYEATLEECEEPSLVTVRLTVQLLKSVIYFEEPLIARWDTQGQCWRTDDIGEVVYNMKEKEISFRMNGFFTVSLLQDAHLNMPYQSWELQPHGTDQAVFSILTTFAEVQIEIKVNQCMLASITTVEETGLLSELKGRWMSPLALTEALKRAGMNIFPAEYSPKYVSINKKILAAEMTTYQQMALLASGFAFSWSKWNAFCGEDQVVFKACEHLEETEIHEDSWALYMFNGQRAQRLQIKEESDAFSKNIAEDTEFHSTLYHLIKDAAGDAAMAKVLQTHFLFIDTVYQLLLATRVLTYA
ncbi:dynein axonemal intermediate chain 7 isoform X3 [Hemicordylus capensis]|uniref:dynein axonemal intermediate chain 7 isoform X3 n=1 Tax=Hemicordylus capensis TaxID=884348 RepID=UPI00230374EF|nr:dynein axonemal intermediate chain 7 isoform X3 [Hemicordylus capensis]